jgi:magnesium-transporting ATPase (P-type)
MSVRDIAARRPPAGARRQGPPPHALPADEVLRLLGTPPGGLAAGDVSERLRRFGPNALPRARPPSIATVILRQFLSPLIYVLLAAAVVSIAIGHGSDAAFIFAVLALNAAIGTVQEHAAERSADALRALIVTRARVVRDGVDEEVDAEALVPGDLVRIEGGLRVPADVRIVSATGLEADESLLTGESLSVAKRSEPPDAEGAPVAERASMLLAGSLVSRGRATGVVVATGLRTELGHIASAVVGAPPSKPPLLVRMDVFSRRIAVAVGLVALVLGAASFARGVPLGEVFLSGVALAVSAIPEGLPVALTVALSIGARRMARRRVIARRLVAVEALGSCTYIASDKTGTLTVNELTVRNVQLPGDRPWEVTGVGLEPAGSVLVAPGSDGDLRRLDALCTAAALCNDGYYGQRNGEWAHHGDAVDVALLVLARKVGISRPEAEAARPRVGDLPFEAEHRFAATLHAGPAGPEAFVKGAVERILPMCTRMATAGGEVALDADAVERDADALAERGFRVIALAGGSVELAQGAELAPDTLRGLTFLGLVGMIDPLRPGAAASVRACREAGIEVAMVTGDHPVTALAIGRDLGLASGPGEVVSGPRLSRAAEEGPEPFDRLVRGARVFARADPSQKLEIVRSLRRIGHFVAVTGDGANDAPALRAAHIGVAMGQRGTDVARESAELVLADDDFSSIVCGIEEGRVAYANVRKVIFLLVSTGAAEIVLFLLAVGIGTPLPLLPVQLLWLNLVTNGIQDVALAFEPAEGGEMARPPRPPREPIFDRVMLVRSAVSAAVMGLLAFAAFFAALRLGWTLDRVRNGVLLMMVLFENVQAGNSRSETQSVLRLSPLRNPLLMFGTIAALALHVASMYAPGVSGVLHVLPPGAPEWVAAIAGALILAGAIDLEKAIRRRWPGATADALAAGTGRRT